VPVPKDTRGHKDPHFLNLAGEMLLGDIPNLLGSITDNDLRFRTAPTALAGFQ
jgi:hypothetical protein